MNEQEKNTYFANYRRIYAKLCKRFRPSVEKALREEITQFTAAYAAQPHVTTDFISPKPIYKALKQLHIVAGLTNARAVHISLKKQVKKGLSEEATKWVWVINEYLKTNGLTNLSIEITNTLKEQINKVIQKGVKEGWGVDRIVRELNDSSFPKWMAERIVRTETNKATNTGAMVAAADLNIAVNKAWLSIIDNRTRRIPRNQYDHLHMNEVQVGYNERFIVPSTKTVDAMLYPGDPSASAGNLCNCRCTLMFIPIRDEEGMVVRLTGKPALSGTGTVSIFHTLLRQAAEIGITQFLVNQLLAEEA